MQYRYIQKIRKINSELSMFTCLNIENFLSLKSISLELNKVNILVGPNASGKSNIARALQLISNHSRKGLPILEGYKSLIDLSFAFNPVINIKVGLDTIIGNQNYKYVLELKSDKYIEQIIAGNKPVIFHDGKEISVRLKDKIVYPSTAYFPSGYYGIGAYASILTALPSDIEPEVHNLISKLREITVHSFAPSMLRLRNDISEEPLLKYYGDNLARYLLYLYLERRRDFQHIEETFKNLIPEVEEIVPHIEGNTVEIWIKIKGLNEPLKPFNISDGTLRILAIISTLYGGFSLVVLEEPENCIHPHILEALMSLIREAPSQVIITTHSPYLLDYAKPEEVYIVEKKELKTNIKKLSTTKEVEAIKQFLMEGGTLGEAWHSGLIGGIP
jgi:predicted ATPase